MQPAVEHHNRDVATVERPVIAIVRYVPCEIYAQISSRVCSANRLTQPRSRSAAVGRDLRPAVAVVGARDLDRQVAVDLFTGVVEEDFVCRGYGSTCGGGVLSSIPSSVFFSSTGELEVLTLVARAASLFSAGLVETPRNTIGLLLSPTL